MQVREAKDFLVQQTAGQAQMEGVRPEGAAPLAAGKKRKRDSSLRDPAPKKRAQEKAGLLRSE